ncbi:hypothetical protein GCM10023259_041240 [Thermocatellispora tengchongensis]
MTPLIDNESDPVMERLVSEARAEFPDWAFAPVPAGGWTAKRGGQGVTAPSLAEVRARLRRRASCR